MTESINHLALARGHYAALRAWLQGLSLETVGGRYLGYTPEDGDRPLPDGRLLLRELLAVRDALIQRAHQHSRPDLAEALQRDIRNSDKGISRAVQAVHSLEQLGTPRPLLKHAVELWFAPALARRLRAAGLGTVEQLIDSCNDRGYGWWRRVPRVGATAAAAIVAWLRRYQQDLGKTVGTHVTRDLQLPVPVASRALVLIDASTRAVPPLEAMRLPAYCDGSTGENRAARERCALEARNDYEALLTWLSLWPAGSATYRAYRKEVERFLAWAVIERAKAISSLKTEDCIAYRNFLANPQPAERWCGPMLSRSLPGWRPFQGPLSPTSQKYAQTVLKRFCEFLTRKHYLHVNPWDEVPALKRAPVRIQTEKALPLDLWENFWNWLDAQAEAPHATQERLARAAIVLLRDSGLRLVEACRADRAGMIPIGDEEGEVWGELSILGKRDKYRDVPLSRRAFQALRAHWNDRGENLDAAAAGPLLSPIVVPRTKRALAKVERGDKGFSTSGLHRVIVRVAERFAATFPEEDAVHAQRAARVRAHALRHTFGTHAADQNVPIDVLQTILGHASMSTTTIYTRPGRERRLREIDKLYGGRSGNRAISDEGF
jgi:site-specific recombinase XerD